MSVRVCFIGVSVAVFIFKTYVLCKQNGDCTAENVEFAEIFKVFLAFLASLVVKNLILRKR